MTDNAFKVWLIRLRDNFVENMSEVQVVLDEDIAVENEGGVSMSARVSEVNSGSARSEIRWGYQPRGVNADEAISDSD